jgi:hypothetical protein
MSDKRAVMTPAERRVYLAAMRAYRAWVLPLRRKGDMHVLMSRYWDALDALWEACLAAERRKGKDER